MNRPLDHLTDALIDRYTRQGSGTALDTQDLGIEAHLADCESCLDRVLQAQRAHYGLLEADPVNQAPHPDCPDEQVLQELAARICSPEVASQAIQHAAHCDHCGPLLNRYLEEFSEELLPEDRVILNQLASGKPAWQERFVREHAVAIPEQRAKRSFFANLWPKQTGWWPKMALAGALAILVVGITTGHDLWTRYELYRAERLVAAAWSERRTIEVRLPSVPFARYDRIPIERAGEGGQELDYDRPALLKAKSEVAGKLQEGKQDPYLLQLEGRLSLLEGTARSLEKAQAAFDKARSQGLDTPSLKIDLAAGYFERDSKADHPNLQKTIDLLESVLKTPKVNNQDRLVAQFDLALAYEKTQAWDMAIEAWEQYLRADSSGPWADEAKVHLRNAKSKIPGPRQQGYQDPSFFLDHVSGSALQQDAEEYQDVALIKWLPDAVKDPGGNSRRAADKLADELAVRHSDPWLKDLLESIHARDLPAVQALSGAVRANHEGLYGQALRQSKAAATAFTLHRNTPGSLRARLEEIYALRSMLRGAECLEDADSLWNQVMIAKYHWLKAQLSLERAQCKNFQGELTEADRDTRRSLGIAKDSHFPVLILRIIGNSAGIKRLQGNREEAWQQGVEGLDLYWQTLYQNGERLDQFYAVMWQSARESGFLYAAESLLRHTIRLRESSENGVKKNSIREAMLHLKLANILAAQTEMIPQKGKTDEEQETDKALFLMKDIDESYVQDYLLTTKIERAELQLEAGNPQLALATLLPARKMVDRIEDNFFSLQFHKALGNISLKLNRLDDAAASYRLAIETAEAALGSLQEGGKRLQWIQATDESYRGMVRIFLDQGQSETALRMWEWYKSRPWIEGHVGNLSGFSKASWAVLQTEIGKAFQPASVETRLVYASFKDGLQIWIIKNNDVKSRWVAIQQEDFERSVRDFARQCATPNSDLKVVREQSRHLFNLALQPVTAELGTSPDVIVELDHPARELPMEALESPEGWYFGANYNIIYSPGMLMEKTLRVPGLAGIRSSMLLVDASQSSGTGYLPGVREEKETITELFPNARIMDSVNMTWANLRHSLPGSDIFTFVGHGKADGVGTDLMLNTKESLKARDFTPNLLRRPQLAVLSACSTGVGRENGMLDSDNLVHSFLSAGVPSVVASRWNVDSESTGRLISSFYRHLNKRESVAQSMSSARKEMLISKKHPYYWASFNVSGRAN
jgi:CHAT domain-containing protein